MMQSKGPLGGHHPLQAKLTTELDAKIVFGVLSKKCKGLGICSISVDPPLENSFNGRGTLARIALNRKNQLVFTFDKHSISEFILWTHFRGEYFEMEEDFILPEMLINALGSTRKTIKAGLHKIKVDADFISLCF